MAVNKASHPSQDQPPCLPPHQVAELSSLPFVPSAVAVLGEDEVAIGGEDHKVYIYDIASGAFTLTATITGPRGQVSRLQCGSCAPLSSSLS